MKKATVEFAIVTQKGVVQEIGRSSIEQPKIVFNGGSIKWYEDKFKTENSVNERK